MLCKGRVLSPEAKLVPAWTELMQEAAATPPGGRSNSATCSPRAPRTSCSVPNEEQLPGIKARLAAPASSPGIPSPWPGPGPASRGRGKQRPGEMLGFVSDSSVRTITRSTSCRDRPLRKADRLGSPEAGRLLLSSLRFPTRGGNDGNPSPQTQHPFLAPAGSSTGTARDPAPSHLHGGRPACRVRAPPGVSGPVPSSSALRQRPSAWDSAGPAGERAGRARGPHSGGRPLASSGNQQGGPT